MALLDRVRGIGRARAITLAALVVAASGCVILEVFQPREKRFAFTHRVHVVDEGLDCGDCHTGVETSDEPGMPPMGGCNLCHADIDADKPPERRIATLFEDNRFRVTRAGALSGEVVFSHLKHASFGMECAQCHAGIEENDDVATLAKPNMDSCVQCHSGLDVANECATCHSVLREDVAPPSHERSWIRRHGSLCRRGAETTADRCDLCHRESDCVTCHMVMQPQNHTNYWRRRGHGVTASLERESCATCHRSDTCDRCHDETRPMNHTGGWGAPLDRHCLSCHFPLQMEGCFTCHKSTPSHALATPKPPDHSPAMNCRQCHGMGQPLPHVDNGDNCNLCHP